MIESRLLRVQHERDEYRAENTRLLLSIQVLCKEVERLREEHARRAARRRGRFAERAPRRTSEPSTPTG